MNEFESLLGRTGLLPHGYCFQWSPGLLSTMAGADALIALAYFSIPLAIYSFVRQRPLAGFGHVPWLFVAFIGACGLTHVISVWTIWRPEYEIHAAAKVLTAAISVFTAVALWRLLPQALTIPSVSELRSVVAELQAEVDRRQTAEQTLAEVEQALSAALAASGAAFVATDAAGHVTRMNAVAETVTGWTQAEARGCIVWDVLKREDRPAGMEQRNPVDVVAEAGAWRNRAAICVARDGVRHALELSAELSYLPDGRVRGINIVFRDVSRLSAAETEVRRLAATVAASTDAIITKTRDGIVTSWNAAAERLYGWTATETVGQSILRLIPPEREAEERDILAEIAQGRVRPPFDTLRMTKDGRRVEVSVVVSPVHDALGGVVGAATSARDLSALRRIEQALRSNEQRLRLAMQAAQLGDWELRVSTGRLAGSEAFARCLGLEAGGVDMTLDRLLDMLNPDDRAAFTRGLDAAVAARGEWHAEFRIRHWGEPEGALRWLRLDGRVDETAERTAPRLHGIVADITAVQEAQAARQRSLQLADENRRILEASRLKSQFLANMSHELRTPLNAVIGFADLLRSGAVPAQSPRGTEYLGHIAASGRHLLQIINDVLDLSKVESGKLDFSPGPVDLPALLDEVVGSLQAQVASKQLDLSSQVAPDLGELWLDTWRLRQVMFNFLSNAIKFTPSGGRIAVRLLPEGRHQLRLEVEDDGIGIAPQEQHRLFVEFQQLEAGLDKRHQGTGLGLALTRRLVEAQDGRVGVWSRLGAGSRFYAVLPRRHGAERSGARLLLAHSEPDIRDEMARALASKDVAVDVAASLAEVKQLVARRHYDGVTLDLLMRDGQALPAFAEWCARLGSAVAPVRALSMPLPDGGSAMFPITNLLAKPLEAGDLRRALAGLAPLVAQHFGARPLLIIDDDPMACELLMAGLAAAGVRAVALHDGEQALARLDELQPPALVLDLMMPGLDGFMLLDRLRSDPRWRELPVIVWTALSLDEPACARLAQSAQSIVAKGGGTVGAVLQTLLDWAAQTAQAAQAAGPTPERP